MASWSPFIMQVRQPANCCHSCAIVNQGASDSDLWFPAYKSYCTFSLAWELHFCNLMAIFLLGDSSHMFWFIFQALIWNLEKWHQGSILTTSKGTAIPSGLFWHVKPNSLGVNVPRCYTFASDVSNAPAQPSWTLKTLFNVRKVWQDIRTQDGVEGRVLL